MQINEEFSNQVVLPDLLAPLEVQEFQCLEDKYKLVKQINSAIFFVFTLIGFFLIAYFSSNNIPIKVIIGVPFIFVVLFTFSINVYVLKYQKHYMTLE